MHGMNARVTRRQFALPPVSDSVTRDSGLHVVAYKNMNLHNLSYFMGSREIPIVPEHVLGQQTIRRDWRVDVGREDDNDLVLDAEYISDYHGSFLATQTRHGVTLYYRDNQSTNGSYVNNRRVMGFIEVRPGDKLGIGEVINRPDPNYRFEVDLFFRYAQFKNVHTE